MSDDSITPRGRKLISAGSAIADQAPDEMTFLHSALCQCHLPRRRTEERVFIRSDGQTSLRIEAGALYLGDPGWVEQPMPYGVKPRIIMLYLTTYAVRHRTRNVFVEESLAGFLRLLGQPTSGGPRGSYAAFRSQLAALSAANISLGYVGRDGMAYTKSGRPINEVQAWANVDAHRRQPWPREVTLSQPFYDALQDLSVPLDPRAIAALSKSSLDLDIYTWLAHRLHRVGKNGQQIHWVSLRRQFGAVYADNREFAKTFKQSLKRVMGVYPAARVSAIRGGLMLRSSSPPIPKRRHVVAF